MKGLASILQNTFFHLCGEFFPMSTYKLCLFEQSRVAGRLPVSVTCEPSCQSSFPPCAFCPLSISMSVFVWAATWYTQPRYTVAACHHPFAGKQGRLSALFFFFLTRSLLKALCTAPLWPLMHPVHLARWSCETQDYRLGRQQFHLLIEPISSIRLEECLYICRFCFL